MGIILTGTKGLAIATLMAVPLVSPVSAQAEYPGEAEPSTTVIGTPPADISELEAGPNVEGFISARNAEGLMITAEDGNATRVALSQGTEVRSKGGFLGLGGSKLATDSLLNGLPVSVETKQWGGTLVASKVQLKGKDLRTASMIRNGTAQGFAEQTAATEALRGRMGDIDKYNVKGTTNVHFATGQAVLSQQAKADLCNAAAQADATENALMLVVGYTDSTGSYEVNQALSEKRASRVVNYLQQACGWKPYRMLTPTGMAESDPAADNYTADGRAQNRRVAVNILVSKSVDGLRCGVGRGASAALPQLTRVPVSCIRPNMPALTKPLRMSPSTMTSHDTFMRIGWVTSNSHSSMSPSIVPCSISTVPSMSLLSEPVNVSPSLDGTTTSEPDFAPSGVFKVQS